MSVDCKEGSRKTEAGSDALKAYGITRVTPVNDTLRKQYKLTSDNGLVITEVDKDSAASYEKGLREGDMLLELNLHEMKSLNDLEKALKGAEKNIVIKFEREGTTNYQMLSKDED